MATGPLVALLSAAAIAQSFGGAHAEYRNLGKPGRHSDDPDHGFSRGSAATEAPVRGLWGLPEATQQEAKRSLEELKTRKDDGEDSEEDKPATANAAKAEWPPRNSWPTSSGRTCIGRESEADKCPDLPACEECKPVNCKFREWSDWLPYGRCTGLQHRKRAVERHNNHCGKPCDGPEVETARFDDPHCAKKADCKLTDWSSWTTCQDQFDQKRRSRDIETPALDGGAACNGTVKETLPCGDAVKSIDCDFSEWIGWTNCSKKCGSGYQTNHRHIKTFAAHGGAPCQGELRIERECNVDPCDSATNCEMADWSEWEGCTGDSPTQRTRFRRIKSPSKGGGAGCRDAMEETMGCPKTNPPEDCKISDWGAWGKCSKSCDGGQRSRKREMEAEPVYGGGCGTESLEITEACNEQPCFPDSDCSFSDWEEWNGCERCGDEVKTRERSIKTFAKDSGKGCIGDLSEALSCPTNSSCQRDCEWNTWDEWSACTCSCGAGTKRRNRRIKASPRNGGQLCATEDSSEVAPCNTEPCETCIDGIWDNWEDWTDCSATCDIGFKSRHRDVKRHPNHCGKTLLGVQDEFVTCSSCRKVGEKLKPGRLLQGGAEKVAFAVYPNYCVDANNKDVGATPRPNVLTYSACQEFCTEDPACDAFEYRGPGGEQEPVKCWTLPGLMHGADDLIPTHAKVTTDPAKLYEDATCNIKKELPACPESLPEIGSECDTDMPCHYDSVRCPGRLAREFTTSAMCISGKWQILQRLVICPEETPYIEFPTVLADAKNVRIGVTPHPDIRTNWQCRQVCNKAPDCSGYEFAKNSWTDPVTCWTAPGTEGGPYGVAVRGFQTLSQDPAMFKRTGYVKEVQPQCPPVQPDTGDTCAVDTSDRTCDYQPFTCPDGTTTYLSSASCKDGQWQLASKSVVCTQCPETVPVFGTQCTGTALCYYNLDQCANGDHYFTFTAQCYQDAWLVLSGGGCGAGHGSGAGGGAGGGGSCPANMEEVPCVEARDCELDEWTEWSQCSCSCFGVKERHRRIKQFPTLGGAPCKVEALKEISQCNPGLEPGAEPPKGCGAEKPRACVFDTWSEWGECSQLCGGGQRYRERPILSPNSEDGSGCDGEMSEVQPCNMVRCPKDMCNDCLWSLWGDWSSCTQCGDQRHRSRHILRMPNHCGKRCSETDAVEVANCTSPCHENMFCAWTEWSTPTACSAPCGPSTRVKQRTLQLTRDEKKEPLFIGTPSVSCGGTQTLQEQCKDVQPCKETCEPQDCVLSDWREWADCSCTQLKERSRNIEKFPSCGGKICDEVLVETARCEHKCEEPEPCKFSDWEDWSYCKSFEDQRTRQRHILQLNINGGTPCNKTLKETSHCSKEDRDVVDCALSDWREWTDCTAACGAGTKSRSRHIKTQSSRGGKPCEGNLEMVAPCQLEECEKQDCKLDDWSSWSDCNMFAQASRSRVVTQQARGMGKQCEGALKEIKECSIKVDCKVSGWTDWDKCSKSCGGGQTTRHRTIDVNPKNGGLACPTDMVMTKGCNTDACNRVDCEPEDWSGWTTCSATCGVGMRKRERAIKRYAKEGGIGCSQSDAADAAVGMPLEEWEDCADLKPCAQVDCKWGSWHPWSACTCSCGGGQKTRVRHIDVTPLRGGTPCDPKDKDMIIACNTQSCEKHEFCTDGTWGSWSDWSECSKSCDFGVAWRNRRVARPANVCGEPPVGDAHETRSCNIGIQCGYSKNCTWGDWEQWSDCTAPCGGIQQRGRTIATSARGPRGEACAGDMKESKPCKDAATCDGPKAQDCQVEQWGAWSTCTATCGPSGSMSRTRAIIQPPMHGGKPCPRRLGMTARCNTDPCPEACKAEDGKWGDWGDWGACAKCGGERHRFRHVEQQAKCGGKPLTPDASEMVGNCTRKCHEKEYCVWDAWQSWEACHATCGHGTRTRTRHLTTAVLPGDLVQKSEELPGTSHQQLAGSGHLASQLDRTRGGARGPAAGGMQGFALAFAAGGLTCLIGLAIFRLSFRGAGNPHGRTPRYANLNEVEMVPGEASRSRHTL